ncbi:MAG: glutathione S-transferase C-terminal domain-containing protein [Pseudomonadota bacterium]
MKNAYQVYGTPASPFSMKLRGAFRAKRLPMIFRYMTPENRGKVFPNVRVPVIPIVQFPDGEWHNDSTPLLIGLEGEGRSILPPDPAARFACLLLEDMADEWFMKAMFHFCWGDEAGGRIMARYLAFDSFPNGGADTLASGTEQLYAWQNSRHAMVGTVPESYPALVQSFRGMIDALEDMAIGPTHFLFGDRPSLADMAFYGPLAPLDWAPEGRAYLMEHAPTLHRWILHADDASGIEGEWTAGLSEPVKTLLSIAGRDYLPFLMANAGAREAGDKTMSVELDGGTFVQQAVGYQAKCLIRLRSEWAELEGDIRSELAGIIGSNARALEA